MKKIIIILFIFISFVSCDRQHIKRIVANQDKIVSVCQNKAYWHRGITFCISTYKNSLENEYFFTLIDSIRPHKIVFSGCRMQFIPDSEIGIFSDTLKLDEECITLTSDEECKKLCGYLFLLKNTIDLFGIRSFGKIGTSNPIDEGLIFFLENGSILEFRPQRTEEIEGYKKVSEHWYLYKNTW